MLIKVPGVKWAVQRVFRMQRSVTLGVRVVIRDADQRVFLVRHGYAPGWHLPGGGVDRGENLLQAVLRETREETGIRLIEPPRLFAVYSNFEAFPRDHVALFIAGQHVAETTPASSFEIREGGFYPLSSLPPDATEGTRRRLAEVFNGAQPSETW